MTHRSLLLAGLMLLGACAHRGDPALPTCDGTARRPANPHGSVLAPWAEPRPAEAAVNVGPDAGPDAGRNRSTDAPTGADHVTFATPDPSRT